MKTGYDIFVSQIEQAIVAYPTLRRVKVNGKHILKGVLAVIDKNGTYWADYEIEIHSTENFPNEFPILFETSDKIPKIADWHIYEDTLSCCVKIKPEEILRCRKGITIKEYICEEVLPYLFNQTHRRIEGYYVNGEYGHGKLGMYQYYSDLLNTGNNIQLTIQLMLFISNNERPGRTASCFCGRNIKFRDCHRNAYDRLKQLGSEMLQLDAYSFARVPGFR